MRVCDCIRCEAFPCKDVNKDAYRFPDADIDFEKVKIFMISEAPPIDKSDYFYMPNNPFHLQTGKNYLIEKSKRRMIAEDIKQAIELLK